MARAATVGVLALAFALASSAGAASGAADGSDGSRAFVRLTGRDAAGNRTELTWGPHGGDVTTTGSGGTSERVWFDGARIVRQGISGDVYTGNAGDLVLAQAERIVLSGAFRTMHADRVVDTPSGRVAFYLVASDGVTAAGGARSAQPFTVYWTKSGEVRDVVVSRVTYRALRFEGPYAVAWRASDGRSFERTEPVRTVGGLPGEPQTAWARTGVPNGVATAAVNGRPARLQIDTALKGLRVSAAFARVSGARPLDRTTVSLTDVVIAGKRLPAVAASVVPTDRYDIAAGIGVFPGTSLAFGRGGATATTSRTCGHGVPFDPWSGVVMLPGPEPGVHTTLLATGLDGSARDAGYLVTTREAVKHVPTSPFGAAIGYCTVRPLVLAFGGSRFGSDEVCSNGVVTPGAEPFDLVVGLHSMEARELLVDLRNDTVCWFS